MKTQLCVATICLAASLPLHATGLFVPAELSDQELSQLRGRYVLPGRIVNFGVTMASTWQNASGQVLGAKVNMQIQQNMPKPVFNITTFNEDNSNAAAATIAAGVANSPATPTTAPTPGTGQLSGGNSLNNVQGVVQTTRSAGDLNTSYNNLNIDVSHGNKAPAVMSGSQIVNRVQTSDAGTVRVSPMGGGLQLAIDANGQGASLQQLGAGGAVQRTDIYGSRNTVTNFAALNVLLKENMPTANGLNCNWNQLNNLRPTGL
ncbi:hypothetical protein ACVTMO_01105 [Pseudomonas segetis]|uniref:Fap system outer membrane protein n=1 Tax=Pseudomonas segetis TaxID=298908 RepID=A0A239FK79_9PSED|nr:hypothetical protein [Pseudomonas segetis]SNS57225.1 hypothetical protein SAMN05216255_2655 [Pseudomonas segetis]